MVAHRFFSDRQGFGNFLVGFALRQQPQNSYFALAEGLVQGGNQFHQHGLDGKAEGGVPLSQ